MSTLTLSKRVCGVVLSYNPELSKIKNLVDQCLGVCDSVIIVDNDSENFLDVKNLFSKKCILISNGKNIGVAAGYNRGINFALNMGFNYVVLLDQDGDLPSGFLVDGISRINQNPSLVIIAPKILNHGVLVRNQKLPILSGMLINMSLWEELGQLNENLYTDFIDFEWSNRVLSAGYGIEFLDFHMMHRIGRPIHFFRVYSLHEPLRLKSMTLDAIYLVKHGYSFGLLYILLKALVKNLIFQPLNFFKILSYQCEALKIALFSRGGKTK